MHRRDPLEGLSVDKMQLLLMDYKNLQEQYKKLAERFQLVVESGKIGVWEFDPHTEKIILDDQILAIYGVDSHQYYGSYDDFKKALHPDDTLRTLEEFQQAITNKKGYDTEFRIIRPNGEIRYLRVSVTYVEAEDGKLQTVLGVNIDITKEQLLTNDLKQLNKNLEHHAYYDNLTGLLNRHAFKDIAEQLFAQAQRQHNVLGVLFLDLDGFKFINDEFGHETGDQVLIRTAKVLKKTLRKQDFICRYGGDEFALILNGLKSVSDAEKIAQKIIHNLNQVYQMGEIIIRYGVSIGIAIYPEMGHTLTDLLKAADKALLQAKKNGRNCCVKNVCIP